ncbi:MAG: hypothetical protein JWR34_944 [Mycobacterium sp.]|jgi:hypothetical protein|nr:hypothetical protein [Mycobacterium sp.]
MMSTPTVAQLVTAIRAQLSEVVAPAVEDPAAGRVLGMVDHLLQTIAVRAEHEIEWMVTHVDDVVGLAEEFVVGEGGSESIDLALNRYRAEHRRSLSTSAMTANFALANGVLSAILETTVSDDGPLARRARDLMRRDVAHAVDIVGDFALVPP